MIGLVLSALPMDEVPGQVALTTIFEDVRPLKGSTGLVDWRLNGRLSELIQKERLSGYFSESLIMPSQGRLTCREIVVFGLGKVTELSEKRFEEGLSLAIDKLSLLKSENVVISLGDLVKDFMSWRSLLRNFMTALIAKRWNMPKETGSEFQVICAEDPRWISEAKKRNMDFGPEVTLSYA